MERQTAMGLAAAAVFGVIMATASIANGEPRSPATQLNAADCRAEFGDYQRCVAGCSDATSSPQQTESCQRQCWETIDPACRIEYLRQPQARASISARQAVTQRR